MELADVWTLKAWLVCRIPVCHFGQPDFIDFAYRSLGQAVEEAEFCRDLVTRQAFRAVVFKRLPVPAALLSWQR